MMPTYCFPQYPSLHSQFSARGYTSQAAEIYGDIFDGTKIVKLFSTSPQFEMMLFRIESSTFPQLQKKSNPWKQPTNENQLALLGNPKQPSEERSITSITSQLLAMTLATLKTKMTKMHSL